MNKVVIAAAALLLLTAPALPASAAGQDFQFVTTDEVKKMIDDGGDFLLGNALSPIEFAEKRIPGSVNIPYSHLSQGLVELPEDKGKKLVFYCLGPKCTKSKKVASLAMEKGYTSVYVYDEGLPAWMKKGFPIESDVTYPDIPIPALSAADLKEKMTAASDLFILDIRDGKDRKAGSIEGSVNIPLGFLDTRFEEVPKGRKIVVVCLHGKQSLIAARFLASKGYKDVSRLDGGVVSGWMKAGMPVVN